MNVWLAIGAFLHSFIDSFTTEKDKGVEWLFPFSRLVKRGRYTLAATSKDDGCKLELVDQKPPDRVCFINEDSPETTKLSDPDLKESRAVPWHRTYGPAANGQLFDRWLALASFSLLLLALVNTNFAMAGKNLILSTRIIPPMSLLTGIVLVFLGGLLKKNKRNKKGYLTLFAVGGVFMILSTALSIGEVSSYLLPIGLTFVAVGCVVLFVGSLFVCRLSTRGGRKH